MKKTIITISLLAISINFCFGIFYKNEQKYIDEIKNRIETKEDLNNLLSNNLATPLTYAVGSGNIELVKTLIEMKVDLNKPDLFGSPLYHAAQRMYLNASPNPEIFDLLIEYKADPSMNNSDCLAYLVRANQLSRLQLCIELGANPLVIDESDRNLLHHNVLGSFSENMWNYLLSLGVDPNHKDERGIIPMGYYGK